MCGWLDFSTMQFRLPRPTPFLASTLPTQNSTRLFLQNPLRLENPAGVAAAVEAASICLQFLFLAVFFFEQFLDTQQICFPSTCCGFSALDFLRRKTFCKWAKKQASSSSSSAIRFQMRANLGWEVLVRPQSQPPTRRVLKLRTVPSSAWNFFDGCLPSMP